MKIKTIRRNSRNPSIPLLDSARMRGKPKSWPSEKLERLLTPLEIDQIMHHRI